jgi:hypothetical protein
MTAPKNQQKTDRTDDARIVGLFATFGIVAAALVLFVAHNPDAGKLASDIAQAEFPIVQSLPAPTYLPVDLALAPSPQTAHLAANR